MIRWAITDIIEYPTPPYLYFLGSPGCWPNLYFLGSPWWELDTYSQRLPGWWLGPYKLTNTNVEILQTTDRDVRVDDHEWPGILGILWLEMWLLWCSFQFAGGLENEKEGRDKFMHTVNDDKYETLLLLVKGKSNVWWIDEPDSRKVPWCASGEGKICLLLALNRIPHYILMGGKWSRS